MAGSKKGVPNKNKRGLAARLKAEYGDEFDVIMLLGRNCNTLHQIAVQDCEAMKMAQDRAVAAMADEDDEAEDILKDWQTMRATASASAQAAVDKLEKLAQYVEPKLKQVEVSLDVEAPMIFNFQYGGALAKELVSAAVQIGELADEES